MERRISVFGRFPNPGEVKTRLVPFLGAEGAAGLQRAMLEDLLENLDRSAAGAEREIRMTGKPSQPPLVLPKGWRSRPQGAGNLGDRISRAVMEAAREGHQRLVILGSDAPLLPDHLLEEAFAQLETGDAVLAPAEDGGYVLIGFACGRAAPARIRQALEGVSWSSPATLEETRAALTTAGLGHRLLGGFWDVDRPEDVLRLRDLAGRFPDRLPRVRRTLAGQLPVSSKPRAPQPAP